MPGHALALAGPKPDQRVLVEAFGEDEGEMWFGKTVAFGDFCALDLSLLLQAVRRGAAERVRHAL